MGLFSERRVAYGMIHQKCPRCHNGDFFEHPILTFKGSFDMKDRCEICDQNYMPEPGFYSGAMFISYLMTAFFCLGFVFFCKLVLGFSTNKSFFILLTICSFGFIWLYFGFSHGAFHLDKY